jgi:hypothetical protein
VALDKNFRKLTGVEVPRKWSYWGGEPYVVSKEAYLGTGMEYGCISGTAILIDDWQGEVSYMSADGRQFSINSFYATGFTKDNIKILVTGYLKGNVVVSFEVKGLTATSPTFVDAAGYLSGVDKVKISSDCSNAQHHEGMPYFEQCNVVYDDFYGTY